MSEYLLVIDMQNDFIDGALGTAEAVKIVPKVLEKVKGFDGKIIFTRDTHGEDYLETEEGRNLPLKHCIKDTFGWQICDKLLPYCEKVIDKPTFASRELGEFLAEEEKKEHIEKITLIGLCTDICVISNALLVKGFLPNAKIAVDAACCAGVTPKSHLTALEAMKSCQIEIIGE